MRYNVQNTHLILPIGGRKYLSSCLCMHKHHNLRFFVKNTSIFTEAGIGADLWQVTILPPVLCLSEASKPCSFHHVRGSRWLFAGSHCKTLFQTVLSCQLLPSWKRFQESSLVSLHHLLCLLLILKLVKVFQRQTCHSAVAEKIPLLKLIWLSWPGSLLSPCTECGSMGQAMLPDPQPQRIHACCSSTPVLSSLLSLWGQCRLPSLVVWHC